MTIVIDASAILAWMLGEPGGDAVEAALDTAVICTVNVAEIATRLQRDFETDRVRSSLAAALPPTIPVDLDLAIAAGLMAETTNVAGLSLGDRFCLALAQRLGCPVLTADRAWTEIAEAVGVEVRLIR